MSKYGDYSDKQEIYERISYIRRRREMSLTEFMAAIMAVLSDMMQSGYDYYGKIEEE